jgi:hypothetical protein
MISMEGWDLKPRFDVVYFETFIINFLKSDFIQEQ